MKQIIKKLVVLTAVFAVAVPVFAQAPGPRGGAGQDRPKQGQMGRRMGPGGFNRMQKNRQELLNKLNLTQAQKKKLEDLDAKTKTKMEALRPKNAKPGERPSEETRKKFQEVMKEHREGMDKILTAEQGKKFQALLKEQRETMRKQREKKAPVKP